MDRDSFLCAATTSAKYHQRRHSFLQIIDTSINLLIVLSAASAFGFLIGGDQRFFAQICIAIITLLGIAQIVLQIGKAAFLHQIWYKRWRDVLLDVEKYQNPSNAQMEKWNAERTAIETECVSELRALEVDCRNNAIISLDYDQSEVRNIEWWQRVIIQIGTLQSNFPKAESDA